MNDVVTEAVLGEQSTVYCGVGSCDKTPGHDGIHRCRCGKPVEEPANGCVWHKSSAMLK